MHVFHLIYLILFETYLNSHYTFIPSLHKFFCVKNVAIQMSSKGCAYLYYKHVSSPTLSLWPFNTWDTLKFLWEISQFVIPLWLGLTCNWPLHPYRFLIILCFTEKYIDLEYYMNFPMQKNLKFHKGRNNDEYYSYYHYCIAAPSLFNSTNTSTNTWQPIITYYT